MSNFNQKKYRYNLYGVILHFGNYEGGHYTCYFRRSNSRNMEEYDNINNSWYYFNDDKSEKCSWNSIIKELLFTPSTTIKMVFLSKDGDYNECDHNGLDYIQPIGKSLRLEEYEMYYPEDLVGYEKYLKKHPLANANMMMSVINYQVPLHNPIQCPKCFKYYYPF